MMNILRSLWNFFFFHLLKRWCWFCLGTTNTYMSDMKTKIIKYKYFRKKKIYWKIYVAMKLKVLDEYYRQDRVKRRNKFLHKKTVSNILKLSSYPQKIIIIKIGVFLVSRNKNQIFHWHWIFLWIQYLCIKLKVLKFCTELFHFKDILAF